MRGVHFSCEQEYWHWISTITLQRTAAFVSYWWLAASMLVLKHSASTCPHLGCGIDCGRVFGSTGGWLYPGLVAIPSHKQKTKPSLELTFMPMNNLTSLTQATMGYLNWVLVGDVGYYTLDLFPTNYRAHKKINHSLYYSNFDVACLFLGCGEKKKQGQGEHGKLHAGRLERGKHCNHDFDMLPSLRFLFQIKHKSQRKPLSNSPNRKYDEPREKEGQTKYDEEEVA